VALPTDHPSEKNDHTRQKIEARDLADIAARMDPVPAAVLDAARDAFSSRHARNHPETRQVPVDSDAARAVEAAKNVEG